ncbi:unnamed protein product [Mytilus coruscus]|uniref:Uncharacterized protein n=1 Tax=Mytilus coruscus TaxID=42192 RepID=A0A6J8ESY1_MYTCO|nr:unnamed protein product [Mytilus coruscus]
MEIPRVIRNVIKERIISNYQNYCEESNFELYSRPRLYRFLKVCAASKQKALQGLDNTTYGGMGAINALLKLVTKLETFGISHDTVEKLKDNGCTDHCTTYALSDPSISYFASSCEHHDDANCDKCSLIENVLTTELPKVQVNELVQDDIDFDLNKEFIGMEKTSIKNCTSRCC